jgi:choline dehydrogenase-like flavoprotein
MIIDFNDDSTPLEFNADICIVGSGAASLAMLTKFYNTKHKVIVIEAGEENVTDKNQEIYNVIAPYHPFEGAHNGRFRVFGGSTTRWGGQSLPLDKIDFRKREWLPDSGWPIPYDNVSKYYSEVDSFLRLDPAGYDNDIFALLKEQALPEASELQFRFSKWSPAPNLREHYRKIISTSSNINLLINANLRHIKLTEDHKDVQELVVKNFNNKQGRITAKKYVLACGGIENARILLASNSQLPNGVGNSRDLVGRFLQDHPRAEVATLTVSKKQQAYFNYFYLGKTRILPRFFFSDDFQAKNKILNTTAFVEFYTKEDDVFTIAKEIYRKQVRGTLSLEELKQALRLVKNIPQLLQIAKHYYIDRKVYTPNALARLNVMTEAPPLRENTVSLSSEVDALGMPKAIVKWKIDETVRQTFVATTHTICNYLTSAGFGKIEIDDWLNSEDWVTHVRDSKHHIGTTRMASSPENGVVDENCKVFDLSNLYIAGSSVFPTSGQSNPTATLIALAFRLANRLKEEV